MHVILNQVTYRKAKSEIRACISEIATCNIFVKKMEIKANGAPNTQLYVQESSSNNNNNNNKV